MAVFVGLLLLAGAFILGAWCGRQWGSNEIDRGYTRLIEKVVERVKDQ